MKGKRQYLGGKQLYLGGNRMYMKWESEVPGREAEGKIAKDAVRSLLELEGEAGEVRQLHGTNKYPCSS